MRYVRSSVLALLSLAWQVAHAASFDCIKASTSTERLICATPRLSLMDAELAALYRRVLDYYKGNQDIKNAQRDWLKSVRNACTDGACLERAYESRILSLRTAAEKLGVKVDDIADNVDPSAPAGSAYAGNNPPPPEASSAPTLNAAAAIADPEARGPSWSTTDLPKAVGPQIGSADAGSLLDVRLGRCAVAYANSKNFEGAEGLMSNGANRQLVRGTYVRLLQQNTRDPKGARENYTDACAVLGIVSGNPGVVPAYMQHFTAYEMAHPDYTPASASRSAAEIAMRANAAGRAQDANLDPVNLFKSRFLEMGPRCPANVVQQGREAILKMDELMRLNEATQIATARNLAAQEMQMLQSAGCIAR